MKNVLHVIDTLDIGGAEKVMVGIVNGLPGYKHHIAYLNGKNTLQEALPPSCELYPLNFRSKRDILSCIKKIRSYIRQKEIEIVHSHLVLATLLARMASPRNVKLFNHVQSMVGVRFFGPGKFWQRRAEKFFYKKWHHLIVVSEEVLQDYDHYIGIKGPVTILPNFVDDKFFSTGPKACDFRETIQLVTVGNLKPAKNYHYLFEAFKHLPKTVKLDIYGDGPQKLELQELIKKNELDNIRLCGSKSDVHTILPEYDLFVMSSKVEGHPVALMEAMASGLPAIVSDIKVLREATDGKAIYFDLDNVMSFVALVKEIINHKVDLNEYAKFNYEWAKKSGGKANFMKVLSGLYN